MVTLVQNPPSTFIHLPVHYSFIDSSINAQCLPNSGKPCA